VFGILPNQYFCHRSYMAESSSHPFELKDLRSRDSIPAVAVAPHFLLRWNVKHLHPSDPAQAVIQTAGRFAVAIQLQV